MGRVHLLAVLLVFGCGGPEFEPAMTCATQAPRMMIHLEAPGDCAYYEAAARDAVAIAVLACFATPEEEERSFAGLTVWVRARAEPFDCGSVEGAWGCYHPTSDSIELTADATSFLHELLHRLEHTQGGSPSTHAGWETRGAQQNAPTVEIPPGRVSRGSWWEVSYAFKQRWWQLGGWPTP